VRRRFEVIEITNEMPHNRIGGVGSVIESLMSGFEAIGVEALWYVTDHEYPAHEIDAILAAHRNVVFGSHAELAEFEAPVRTSTRTTIRPASRLRSTARARSSPSIRCWRRRRSRTTSTCAAPSPARSG
jgi:hypothetical protein